MIFVLLLAASAAHSAGRGRVPLQPIANHHDSWYDAFEPRDARFDPGSLAPRLRVATLDGTLDTSTLGGSPILFNAFRPGWGFSDALWRTNSSIDDLIERAPSDAHFVFLHYADTNSEARTGAGAESPVSTLRKLFAARLMDDDQKLFPRLHFVRDTVEALGDVPASKWVSTMLRQFPTFLDSAEATVPSIAGRTSRETFEVPLLNSHYDWLGWSYWPSGVFGNRSMPLVYAGDGCTPNEALAQNLSGRIALLDGGGNCDYYDKIKRAAAANASGVGVIGAPPTSGQDAPPLVSMNCRGAECDDQSFGLSAFMLPFSQGQRLKQASIASTSVSTSAGDDNAGTIAPPPPTLRFRTVASPGTNFGVDGSGRLQQTWGGSGLGYKNDTTYGNPGDTSCKLYPSLSFVAWAAQWLVFSQGIEARVAAPGHVVSVFDRAPLRPQIGNCYGNSPWGCGPSSVVDVPSAGHVGALGRHFSQFELDFALGCGLGKRDIDCPKWDHVISAHACCGEGQARAGFSCNAAAGFEIGRWITTFGRGIGRWVTDVTTLLPLLQGDPGSSAARACNLTVFSVPWAGNQGKIPWTGTLNLRFTEPAAPAPLTPFKILQPWHDVSTEQDGAGIYSLFKWISFNQSYEKQFPPFNFVTPPGTERAMLSVVVSGHGNDNHGCGEFCSTSHHFSLNGHQNIKRNNNPSNAQLGCADSVVAGTTPNEYGTWLYGRDGWCDGRQVEPWEVDVTTQLQQRAGGNNTLSYRGLWNNSIPDPSSLEQGAPVMMLRVSITFYKAKQ